MIYRAENLEISVQVLEDFIAEWKPKYRKVMESLENTDNLLTFYQFPYQIWHSIYSTNIIESLNKEIKRQTKKRFFFLTRKLWNVTQLLCLKIIISSKVNESIKGLANVLTHLKAYLCKHSVTILKCLHIIIDTIFDWYILNFKDSRILFLKLKSAQNSNPSIMMGDFNINKLELSSC